jgi:hypothetical protein
MLKLTYYKVPLNVVYLTEVMGASFHYFSFEVLTVSPNVPTIFICKYSLLKTQATTTVCSERKIQFTLFRK